MKAFGFNELYLTQVLIFVLRKLGAADFTSDGPAPVFLVRKEEFAVRAFIQLLTNAEIGTRVKSGLFVLQVTLAHATRPITIQTLTLTFLANVRDS